MPSELQDEYKWLAISAWKRSGTIRAAARETGLSYCAVYRWVKRYQANLPLTALKRKGPKRLVSTEAARKARELLLSNECHGAKDAARALHSLGLTNKLLSASTILRAAKRQAVLDGVPIRAARGRPAKRLTPDTMAKRLAFAIFNRRRAWKRVMFTDRKKFLFFHPGCKVKPVVWLSGKGGRQETRVNRPQALNVYAGLTVHGLTSCVIVAGSDKHKSTYTNKKGQPARNITAKEYRDVMIKTLLPEGQRLMSGAGLSSWVYQQDNDPTHRAASLIVQSFNRGHGTHIEFLPMWPPNSPDLNPIENIWAYVQRRVYAKGCKTFDQFKTAVLEEMASVPQQVLAHLYTSMPKRIARVIETGGGKTKY